MNRTKDFIVDYRPQRFSELWGNADIKRMVKGWVLKDIRPNSIVLVGRPGIGKTTIGKLIAQRFNCRLSPKEEIESCGKCDPCTDSILHPQEFDLTNLSVDAVRYYIRSGINLFNFENTFYFDEMQRWQMKNQEIFLKPIEEAEGLHFVFSTSDIEAIEPAILSRSVILEVCAPSQDEMVAGLMWMAEYEIKIKEEVLRMLIKKSRNTPRTCLCLFNLFAVMGEEITERTLDSDLVRKILFSR